MTQDKLITFSNEQKDLIWKRFVQPSNGTQEEARHFVEVCEQFGLNPLLGDIVFQRFESKYGARTTFITTRDGLLRVASTQPGYVGPPNCNVVKEGDDFEFLPAEGTVKHKFGTQRGKIEGAYAIMQHKHHNPVAIFVDFDEYYQANSGQLNSRYGNKNVWDKMPSAMIIKTAESFVLKRQFPLGGLYTQEEMGLENMEAESNSTSKPQTKNDAKQKSALVDDKSSRSSETLQKATKKTSFEKSEAEASEATDQKSRKIKGVLKSFEEKKSPKGNNYGLITVLEENSKETYTILSRNEDDVKILQSTTIDSEIDFSFYTENGFNFLGKINSITDSAPESEQGDSSEQKKSEESNHPEGNEQDKSNKSTNSKETNLTEEDEEEQSYQIAIGKLTGLQTGKKGNTEFIKMAFETEEGNKMNLIANNPEHVAQAKSLTKEQPTSIKYVVENGFNFFAGIDNEEQQAG